MKVNKLKKSNEIKNVLIVEKIMKYILYLVILNVIVVRFEIINFISPKIGVPLAYTGTYFDFYNKAKINILIVLSVFLLFFFMYNLFKNKINYNYSDIIVAFMAVIFIFSSIFSDYNYIALWGTYEVYNGTIYLIMMLFFFFISSKLVFTDSDFNKINVILGFIVMINIALGVFYYLGFELLQNNLFKRIILVPTEYYELLTGYIMGTLSNPNYLSGFSSIIFVYFMSLYLFNKEKKNFHLFFSTMSFIFLLLARSLSGVFSVLAILPFLFFYLYYFRLDINKKEVAFKSIVLLLILFILGYFASFFPRVLSNLNDFKNLFFQNFLLYALYFIIIIFLLFLISHKNNAHYLYKYKLIPFVILTVIVIFGFRALPVSEDYNKHFPNIIYSEEELLTVIDKGFDFERTELSNREYIWWYTLDLAKDKPILGYGMTTLILEFPNTSFKKMQKIGHDNVVGKPHNHYLEILYGAGLIGLILFLILFLNIAIDFFYYCSFNTDYYVLAIFLGMLSFLVQGLINDFDVGAYAAIFILFGIMVSKMQQFIKEDL